MFFEIDDKVISVITKEEFIIDYIRRDGRYMLRNTFDNTYLALTYHQLMSEFILA